MNPPLPALLLAALAGLALGLFFFAGLRFTVVRLPRSRRPALLLAVSFLLRLSIVLTGFLLVLQGDWRNAVAALCGLLAGRFLILRPIAPEATVPHGARNQP